MNRIYRMILLWVLLFAKGLSGQPSPDPKAVEKSVNQELDAWQSDPAQSSYRAKHFPDIKGTVVADITVSGKGHIETFFLSETDIRDQRFLEYLQKQVKKLRLQSELRKGLRQKVCHRFVWK
jgi:hypothetical protein